MTRAKNLTVSEMLLLTAPKGLGAAAWAEVLINARDADAVWQRREDDTWSEGSDGWREFCDGSAGQAVDDLPPVLTGGPIVGRAASREEFLAAVASRFPTLGRSATPGNVLSAMARYGQPDGSNIYPSNGRIAEETGIANRATVNRHVRAATSGGWLRVDGKVGKAIKYRLTVPPHV